MLNKLVASLAAVGICITGFANDDMATPSFSPFTGKVTGSKVRMRTQPSLDGHVVRETNFGELFAVMGEEEGYYAISPPKGTKGYVFRTFVLDNTVEGEHVNVRLYPDIEAPIVGQFNTGDHIETRVSDINNKWLVVDLPQQSLFYVAKEFFENAGPLDYLAKVEARHAEASHTLSAVFLYAQSEIQRQLQQIDLDSINTRFSQLVSDYSDLPEIVESAQEASRLIQEVYIQKKIAFLESKADHKTQVVELDPMHVEKLAALGIHIKPHQEERDMFMIGDTAASVVGLSTPLSDGLLTDKMLAWQPREEALFHLWAAANGDRSINEFYLEESVDSTILSGIIEPYNRPVKNLPGDYLLRTDNHPVAFLYSTRVNLQNLAGKKVTVVAAPRPNNNFAFPAYFVLSVE